MHVHETTTPSWHWASALLASVLLCSLPGTALATGETRINTVGYDLPTLTLMIDGVRFANNPAPNAGLKPYVEFGGAPVTVLSWSPGSITVQLLAPLSEGEYQIHVERQDAAVRVPHAAAFAAAGESLRWIGRLFTARRWIYLG